MTTLWALLNKYESSSRKHKPGRDLVIYGSASMVRTHANLDVIGRSQV